MLGGAMSKQINYVFFADIKGYSHLTERQIIRLKNDVLPIASRRIEHNETSCKNTWGDGIVIFSNSLKSICSMALELRDFFINNDWTDAELPHLQIRSSIHQGENSALKDPFTGRDTVIGPNVIRAARLEPITKLNQVWVTKAVAIQIQAYESTVYACDPLGSVALAKSYGPEDVYALWRKNEPDIEPIPQSETSKYRVGIGIVVDKKTRSVLLVKIEPGENLSWMFPSTKIFTYEDDRHAIFSEVAKETGVPVVVHQSIGSRIHPVTGKDCHYFFCTVVEVSSVPANLDEQENIDVAWVPIQVALDLIGSDVYEEVRAALNDIRSLD